MFEETGWNQFRLDNLDNQAQNAKIDLCIIDTSQQSYITPKTSQKYLDIITKIINDRVEMTGLEPVWAFLLGRF